MGSAIKRSWLERVLNLFTEVRSGEGAKALLLTMNVFLLLTAYYIIKPVREALILSGQGAEIKSYASAGQALLLLGAVPLYSKLASMFPRRRLINVVTLFFMACLIVFYFLALLDVPLGVVFFLWVGIFNLMVVAQFWSFANDVYTPEEGKRLFVLVAFGASFGAVMGSKITGVLIAPLGVYQLMLVSCAVLGLSLVLTNIVDSREKRRWEATRRDGTGAASNAQTAAAMPPPQDEVERSLSKVGGFSLVLGSRYLLMIALLMLFLNWVNTTGEYILGKLVEDTANASVAAGSAGGQDATALIGKFYSDFFFVVNIVGLLMQLFLVSRILKYLGVRVALLILPLIALGGYALLVFYPVLKLVRWIKTAENATDYSLQNTVRNVLFLPTSREEKYKAKQAIDTFFVRAGDVLSALLVYVGTSFLGFGIKRFAMVNVGLVVVWLVLAVWIGLEYKRLTRDGPVVEEG